MKQIILISIIAISFFGGETSYANWVDPGNCNLANATDVGTNTGTKTFPKKEGKKILCLKQTRQVSVFTNIQQNTVIDNSLGSCYISYNVNGGQPWSGNNGIAINQWINGCYEASRPDPNATSTVWDLFSNEYWYDVSNPLCGPVTSYNNPNTNSQLTYAGGWVNQELYARVQCSDFYSGCPKENDNITNIYSDFYSLSHRATKIDISFGDIIDNKGTQTCNLGIGEYLYDPTLPKILSILDDQGIDIVDKANHNYFAGPRKWNITVTDPFGNTDQGVSGIKSIQTELYRVKNTYNETVVPIKICEVNSTYLAQDGSNNTKDTRAIELNCPDTTGVQISGNYELKIQFEDHAGNKVTDTKNIYVAPNKNLVPKLIKNSFESGHAKTCLGTTDVVTCTKYSTNETVGYTNPGSCPGTPNTTPQYNKPILPIGSEYTGIDRDIWEPKSLCRTDTVDTPIVTWVSNSIFGFNFTVPVTTNIRTYNQIYGYPRTTFFGTKSCIESRTIAKCTGGYQDKWGDLPSTTIYANGGDYYRYDFNLADIYGNPIHAKSISNFTHIGTGIYLDNIKKIGPSALVFDQSNILSSIDKTGNIGYITLKSNAGGQFGEKFSINVSDWDSANNTIGSQVVIFGSGDIQKFNKLFTAQMKRGDNDTDTVFGQKQSIEFELYRHDKAGSLITNAEINFQDSIVGTPTNSWVATSPTYSETSGNVVDNFIQINNNDPLSATGKVEFIPEILNRFTGVAGIEASPIVRYTINGEIVSYTVSETVDGYGPLTMQGGEINSIYVGGYEQSKGKGGYVSDTTKIGENSWASVRNSIAKNVALLTRNRVANDNLLPNGVKYVSGDQDISGEVDWNTLIITDGNLTISDNFNINKKNIGIILLNNKNSLKGNIYIKPSVAFIGAMIFADGSIESVNDSGNIFVISDRMRTNTLNKQIVFYGGLYSKNTIGGAILGKIGDAYMLPGGRSTNNLQEAIRYDLSFLRMRSNGRDDPNWTKSYNEGHNESVIVLTNGPSQENLPPGFEK